MKTVSVSRVIRFWSNPCADRWCEFDIRARGVFISASSTRINASSVNRFHRARTIGSDHVFRCFPGSDTFVSLIEPPVHNRNRWISWSSKFIYMHRHPARSSSLTRDLHLQNTIWLYFVFFHCVIKWEFHLVDEIGWGWDATLIKTSLCWYVCQIIGPAKSLNSSVHISILASMKKYQRYLMHWKRMSLTAAAKSTAPYFQ